MTGKKWLTIAEAALYVGRSKSAVYKWTERKKNPLPVNYDSDGVAHVHVDQLVKAAGRALPGRPRHAKK